MKQKSNTYAIIFLFIFCQRETIIFPLKVEKTYNDFLQLYIFLAVKIKQNRTFNDILSITWSISIIVHRLPVSMYTRELKYRINFPRSLSERRHFFFFFLIVLFRIQNLRAN